MQKFRKFVSVILSAIFLIQCLSFTMIKEQFAYAQSEKPVNTKLLTDKIKNSVANNANGTNLSDIPANQPGTGKKSTVTKENKTISAKKSNIEQKAGSKRLKKDKVIIPATKLSISEQDNGVTLAWISLGEGYTYNVKRGSSPHNLRLLASSITTNTYSDNSIKKDVTYFYSVTAIKGGIESDDSNVVTKTEVPKAPILYGLRQPDMIKLNWSCPYKSGKYTLSRSVKSGGPYEVLVDKSTSNHFGDTKISPDTTYYYVVKAYDKKGRVSYDSKEIKVEPSDVNADKFNPKGDDDGDQVTNEDELLLGKDPKVKDHDGAKFADDPNTSVKDGKEAKEKKKAAVPKKVKRQVSSKDNRVNVTVYGDDNLSNAPLNVIESNDTFLKSMEGVVGTPVDISADGVDINSAEISISYDKSGLGSIQEDNLTIFWVDKQNSRLVPLKDVKVDKANALVTATTPHFSTYLLGDQGMPVDLSMVDIVFAVDESYDLDQKDPLAMRELLAKKFMNSVNEINPANTITTEKSVRQGLILFSDYSKVLFDLNDKVDTTFLKYDQRLAGANGGSNIADGSVTAGVLTLIQR